MPAMRILPVAKTNLCVAIRATQGQGVMPDGTSRFSFGGTKIHHYMGTSTFSNFTVLPEIAVAKIREDAPFDKVCYIGCGVTTGIGAVINTAKVEPGANAVVFGLGGIGLNVIQGCHMAGAGMIVGVDFNPQRRPLAEKFGMTHFVNPKEVEGELVPISLTSPRVGPITASSASAMSASCARRSNVATVAGVSASSSALPAPARKFPPGPSSLSPPRLEGALPLAAREPHRCAQNRRLVHGGEDQHRRSDHPQALARRNQQRVRPDACG